MKKPGYRWSFFPDVDHSIDPVAFSWIMRKMARTYRKRGVGMGFLVFNTLNQWQRVLMRFYRS